MIRMLYRMAWVPVLCSLFLLPTAAEACISSQVSGSFHSKVNDDLGDYGLILDDADNWSCAPTAAAALLSKLRATLAGNHTDELNRVVGPFQGWLEGAHVSLIFAAALELGAQSLLNTTLDTELQKVRNSYFFNKDPGCTLSNGSWSNACMDDYAIAATAYAWIAQYEKARGRSYSSWASSGQSMVAAALSASDSICIFNPAKAMDPTGRGPCNGTMAELTGGQANLVSLNHGAQNIAYGLGLMTSIASAYRGLAGAGGLYLTPDHRTVARELFEEAQGRTTATGSAFLTNCYRFVKSGSMVLIYNDADCGDSGLHYKPKMFPVRKFYDTVVGGTPTGGYMFDQFDAGLFSTPPTNNFFNWGRKVIYGDLGYSWYISMPPLSGQLDDYDPIGYLDGIDAAGCATGWTCDKDVPNQSIDLDFYVDGFGQFIARTRANGGSEPAVNSLCGGGTAHRFRYCLPAWTKGRSIYAYGLDATGRGFANLPGWACAQNPACTW